MTMSFYEPQTAKKVYLYHNGSVKKDAKLLVVNDRQVRDFGTFLNRVTSGIRAPVAVRNIYTPSHGSKIRSLEELVSGKYYVAGGSEHFKKVKYGAGPKLLPRRQPKVEVSPPQHRIHPVIVAEARYKRPVEKPLVIHVFRNGDELFHGVRVLLSRRVMVSWDHILEIVTEKTDLYTPAKKLCTLDGEVVTQLQDGGKYVAVEGGRAFQRVAYCATNITAARRRRNAALTLPIVTRRWTKQPSQAHPSLPPPPAPLSNTLPPARPQPPPVDPVSRLLVPPQRRKLRPMAGRRNKEARERALLENRDDSVFGGSPVMQSHTHMPSPPPSETQHTRVNGEGESRNGTHYVVRVKDDVILGSEVRPILGESTEGTNEEGVATIVPEGTEIETESVEIKQENTEQTLKSPARLGLEQDRTEEGDMATRAEGGTRASLTGVETRENSPPLVNEEEVEIEKKEEDEGGERGEGELGEGVEPRQDGGWARGEDDSIGTVVETDTERLEGREGGEDKYNTPPETEPGPEVEQNADRTDADEVPEEEEEGVAKGSEVKEEAEKAEMKVLPQDIVLESEPLQTSVDLTMSRKQPNDGGSDNLPFPTSHPTPSDPAGLTEAETESGHVEGEARGDPVSREEGEGGDEIREEGGGEELGAFETVGKEEREEREEREKEEVVVGTVKGEDGLVTPDGAGEGEGDQGEEERGDENTTQFDVEVLPEGGLISEQPDKVEQEHPITSDAPPSSQDTQSPTHQTTPPPTEHVFVVEDSPQ